MRRVPSLTVIVVAFNWVPVMVRVPLPCLRKAPVQEMAPAKPVEAL